MLERESCRSAPIVAAALVLRPFEGKGAHVLLAPRTDADLLGQLLPPGGYRDPSESIAEAANRELGEETGLHPRPVDWYPYPSDRYYMRLYKPGADASYAHVYPFHFVAWNPDMGMPANLRGTQGRWEWISLLAIFRLGMKDPRMPGNVHAMLQHAVSVIWKDKTGWFSKRGITV